jgi:uncharacterized protein (UPF0276 family)
MRLSFEHPRVGLAYAGYVPGLMSRHAGLIDYIEMAFERLQHDPQAALLVGKTPTVLHCASLSIAGTVSASDALLGEVRHWATQMATPWIGEHLAFVTAIGLHGETVNVGYTVAPPLNPSSLERVIAARHRYERTLDHQIILENPPQYFRVPSSTMTQFDFIRALCAETDLELLFDISHFLITARNSGIDPQRAVRKLPLDRIREVHLSGVRYEMQTYWDDHGEPAPEEAFLVLREILAHSRPSAITLEYNWCALFPEDVVQADIQRVRQSLAETGHA